MPATGQSASDPLRLLARVTNWQGFGAVLRALREQSGLSVENLLRKHPTLSRSTISNDELGKAQPPWGRVRLYIETYAKQRNPKATDAQLEAELDPWGRAWIRLIENSGSTPASPPDESTPGTDPEADPTPDESYERYPPRRRPIGCTITLIIGPVLLGIAVLIIFNRSVHDISTPITTTPVPGGSPTTFPSAPATTPTPDLIHASGQVDDLKSAEGIDLDTGRRSDRNDQGVDVVFSLGTQLTSLTSITGKAYFAVLSEVPTTSAKQRCVQAIDQTQQRREIYDPAEGRAVCVRTDEGRYSLLTITRKAVAANGAISFRFVTWR